MTGEGRERERRDSQSLVLMVGSPTQGRGRPSVSRLPSNGVCGLPAVLLQADATCSYKHAHVYHE